MIFITNEKELTIDNTILFFYSSDIHNTLTKHMYEYIHKLDRLCKVLCCDIYYFKTFTKRFDLHSLPSVIIFEGGKAIHKLNGEVAIKDFCAKLEKTRDA